MTAQRTAAAGGATEGAIVFTDIVGFTEFTALEGDEAALKLLAIQDRVVEDILGNDGRVVKSLGDGLLIWFEDPTKAIRASLTLQSRFEEESFEENLPLWVRIGVHFGSPARRGEDLIGHDVNVAARIVALAAPGEVLVSEACTQQVGGTASELEFEEVGPVLMKGIPDPVSIYRAVTTSWL
jgi:adenylate cyclase